MKKRGGSDTELGELSQAVLEFGPDEEGEFMGGVLEE